MFSGSALFEEHSLSDSGLCRNLTDIYSQKPFARKDGTNVPFLIDFCGCFYDGDLPGNSPPQSLFLSRYHEITLDIHAYVLMF